MESSWRCLGGYQEELEMWRRRRRRWSCCYLSILMLQCAALSISRRRRLGLEQNNSKAQVPAAVRVPVTAAACSCCREGLRPHPRIRRSPHPSFPLLGRRRPGAEESRRPRAEGIREAGSGGGDQGSWSSGGDQGVARPEECWIEAEVEGDHGWVNAEMEDDVW